MGRFIQILASLTVLTAIAASVSASLLWLRAGFPTGALVNGLFVAVLGLSSLLGIITWRRRTSWALKSSVLIACVLGLASYAAAQYWRIEYDPALADVVPSTATPILVADRASCKDPKSSDYYFPRGILDQQAPNRDSDGFRRAWYSRFLRAEGEPTLSCPSTRSEPIIRFQWLRAFHRPAAISLSWSNGSPLLRAVLPATPVKARVSVARVLAAEEAKRVAVALDAFSFSSTPSHDDKMGFDGAEWLLEGRAGDVYHFVGRWSPTRSPFRSFCLVLLALAGIESRSALREPIY